METRKIIRQGKVKVGSCGGLYIGFIGSDMQIDYLPDSWAEKFAEGDKVKITIEKLE